MNKSLLLLTLVACASYANQKLKSPQQPAAKEVHATQPKEAELEQPAAKTQTSKLATLKAIPTKLFGTARTVAPYALGIYLVARLVRAHPGLVAHNTHGKGIATFIATGAEALWAKVFGLTHYQQSQRNTTESLQQQINAHNALQHGHIKLGNDWISCDMGIVDAQGTLVKSRFPHPLIVNEEDSGFILRLKDQ